MKSSAAPLSALILAAVITVAPGVAEDLKPKDLESIGSFLKDVEEARHLRAQTIETQRNLQLQSLKLFAEAYRLAAEGRTTYFEGDRTQSQTLLTLADARKRLAETVQTFAQARKTEAEARLVETQRHEVIARIHQLWLQMRITDYEFKRVVQGDVELKIETDRLERQLLIAKNLVRGVADWKTWIAIDYLMRSTGAIDKIEEVIFKTKVPPLKFDDNFVPNSDESVEDDFKGGSLGKLMVFSKKNDLSFQRYGDAHEHIMKLVTFINAGTELSIERLRQINQALRATIVVLR